MKIVVIGGSGLIGKNVVTSLRQHGHEVVPAWHILAPEGDFVILMRFDHDKPEQRARMFELVPPLHGLEARQRLLPGEDGAGNADQSFADPLHDRPRHAVLRVRARHRSIGD